MAQAPVRRTTRAKSPSARAPAKRPAAAKRPVAAKRPAAAKAPPKRYDPTPAGLSDKEHLISVIRETAGCNKEAAKRTLDGLVATITASLKKNQKVQLVGFGSFEVAKRPARKGRNPRTGESIRVKASKSVRFKAGQTLKRAV